MNGAIPLTSTCLHEASYSCLLSSHGSLVGTTDGKELKVSKLTYPTFGKKYVRHLIISLFVVWKNKGRGLRSHRHDDTMHLSSRLGSNGLLIVFCVDSDAGIKYKTENSCLPRTTNSWHSRESYGGMTCVIRSHKKRL